MKNSRFQFEYRANASSLHKSVGELLRTDDAFANQDIYQEYPVNRVNEKYSEGSHHFDWVLPKLRIVIECHGRQHYDATSFTSNVEEAVSNFRDLKRRDKAKKEAALSAGFAYVEVPYFEEKKLNSARLYELIAKGWELVAQWEAQHAEELQLEENQKKLIEEQRLAAIEAERAEQEREKQRQKRQEYLQSERHKKELAMAREFRKLRYRAMKAKQGE
jgi:G:T-mismatch repair DNA endonuclease (very short patch repair protein)